jgi:hypothetical protein
MTPIPILKVNNRTIKTGMNRGETGGVKGGKKTGTL